MQKTATHPGQFESSVLGQLSTPDRFLPVWIGLAMAVGLALGRIFPDLNDQLDRVKVDQTSLPIAIGLLGMMYPVLAKVRYDRLGSVTADKPLVGSSLLLNWVVGPALMFTLAWVFLPDLPEFRTGIILVGLARCIAMVLIWNSLACGDTQAGAVLVVLNSAFQVAAYALLGYFYLETLPGWLGLEQTAIDFQLWDIARSVLIFLGVPLVLGAVTSIVGRRKKGNDWYEQRFLPGIGPWALYSLLFTIVVLFAIQGEAITSQPLDVVRIAVPFLAYFGLMWTVAFAWGARRASTTRGRRLSRSLRRATTSSLRSRLRSGRSASPLDRHWPEWLVRLSKCPHSWRWSTSLSGQSAASSPLSERKRLRCRRRSRFVAWPASVRRRVPGRARNAQKKESPFFGRLVGEVLPPLQH